MTKRGSLRGVLACAIVAAVACGNSAGSTDGAVQDTGPHDASLNSPCALAPGRTCPRGMTCPAGDGCNTCTCTMNGMLTCTADTCPDAGGAACTRNEDCRTGEACIGQLGCGRPRICAVITCDLGAMEMAPYCGCDGLPFRASRNCPTASYRNYGGCIVRDGGARTCSTNADCDTGQACEGAGCDTPDGTCVSTAGDCPGGTASYCACDGTTFTASAMCPRRRFRAFGACP
jgi:hypothetical protein